MKISFLTWLFLMIFSCSERRSQEIFIPKLTDFYSKALSRINEKLKKDSRNPNLLEQKIFYCEQLNWPGGCLDALDQYKSNYGITNQLAQQYIAYYSANQRFQSVVDFISEMDEEYHLSKKFRKPLIESLISLGERNKAVLHINQLLKDGMQTEDLAFVSEKYFEMADTLMATYYLGKVSKLDSSHALMLNYGEILLHLGYLRRGIETLETYFSLQPMREELAIELAKLYTEEGLYDYARNKLKPLEKQDTIFFYISDLYRKDFIWDSAIMYLDSILIMDSMNFQAYKNKGIIYEERGWLSTSLSHFEKALIIDSTDTSISNKIIQIQRKIAFLQR
ncbi:MAG: hypothetical protein AAF620_15835 [Bacteroidota bacterium]